VIGGGPPGRRSAISTGVERSCAVMRAEGLSSETNDLTAKKLDQNGQSKAFWRFPVTGPRAKNGRVPRGSRIDLLSAALTAAQAPSRFRDRHVFGQGVDVEVSLACWIAG
jgi:hypothetical protein